MADRSLVITEANAMVDDFPAIQFEQSIRIIDDKGADFDANPPDQCASCHAVGTSGFALSANYRIVISTRRLSGSGTPGTFGTSGLLAPK